MGVVEREEGRVWRSNRENKVQIRAGGRYIRGGEWCEIQRGEMMVIEVDWVRGNHSSETRGRRGVNGEKKMRVSKPTY